MRGSEWIMRWVKEVRVTKRGKVKVRMRMAMELRFVDCKVHDRREQGRAEVQKESPDQCGWWRSLQCELMAGAVRVQ